jgi:CDP-diacylglycerol---glycerol-3-phosphate 3-phosphatidyltransferase
VSLANWIVILRIIFIPVLVWLLYFFPDAAGRMWATFLFLAMAFSDWLDGFIARRTNTVTDLGKLLDPLSDKLLVTSVLIVFLGMHQIDFWPVLIIVFREIAVEGLRALEILRGRVVAASPLAKIKTFFQMWAVLWLILKLPGALVLLWISVILTVVSGLDYFFKLQKAQ